jgi:hypothetical protein
LHSHPRLATLDEYGSFGMTTEYGHQVSGRTALGGSWSFQYTYGRFPESIGIIVNTLTLHLTFILGRRNAR